MPSYEPEGRWRSPRFPALALGVVVGIVAGCDCRHEPAVEDCDASVCDAATPDAGTDPDTGPCDCPPDAGPTPTRCDDGNPCTADSVVDGVCRFDPLEDDTPCEDGDLCTLGDHCAAAACVSGARAEGSFARLGQLDSLGGKYVAMGEGRFVTISRDEVLRARVQLVARTEAGLAQVSAWSGYLSLFSQSEVLAEAFEDEGVVAVASQGGRQLALFSVTDDEIVRRDLRELGGQIVSMSGHAERLWICSGNSFSGYEVRLVDISDPSAPVEAGAMPLGMTACGSIAVNADGTRVYVNTSAGVRFVDAAPLDTGGDPTLSDVIAPPSSVNVRDGYLLFGTATSVRVLDEADHDELVAVPIARANAATMVGARLLVQGARAVAGGAESFVSLYDVFAAGGPVMLDDVVISTYLGPPSAASFRSDTDGNTLIVGPRMFDLRDGRLDEIRVPALMPTHTLRRARDGLRAYTSSGAVAIDVSDIGAPSFVRGGAFGTPSSPSRVVIDDSLPVPALGALNGYALDDTMRVPLRSASAYHPSPFPVRRMSLDTDLGIVAEDSFSVPHEGTSQLLTAGDDLYRFGRAASSGPDMLAGFWLPPLRDGVVATPDFVLSIPASSTSYRGFDIDPHGRIAVVSTEVDEAGALLFYDLSTSPPTSLGMVVTEGLFRQIRVAGRRVAARVSTGVIFYELGVGEVSRYTTDRSIEQLLVFDGHTAYMSQLHLVSGASAYELAAVRFDGLAPPGVITVEGVASSAVAIDDGLAFGFDNMLVTAHPYCPVAP